MASQAHVTWQSEWMTYFQGKQLPTASRLLCFDTNAGIVLFFIDIVTSKLSCAISDGTSAAFQVHDLTTLWQLKGPIIALTGTQDEQGNVFLGFATQQQSGDPGDSVFFTSGLDAMKFASWDRALVTIATNSPPINSPLRIQSIHLGTAFDAAGYPEASVQYSTSKGASLAIVQTAGADRHFQYQFIAIPSTPDVNSNMISVAGSLESMGRGTFATYKQGGSQTLTFVPTETQFGYTQSPVLSVQSDVHSLHILQRSDGQTDLLVGGSQGLDWYDAADCSANGAGGRRIVSGQVDNVRVAYSTTSHTNLVCLTRNGNELGSIEIDPQARSATSFVTMVRGSFNDVTVSRSPSGKVSRLLYTNSMRQVVMLEQTSLGIWNEKPLSLPPRKDLIPTTAYVSHVKLVADDQRRVANKRLLLTCTSSADLIVNGTPTTVDGTYGAEVVTGSDGSLELIDTSQSLSSATFTLKDVPGATDLILPGTGVMVDPSKVIRDRLGAADAHNTDHLRSLHVGGAPLFDPNTNFEHLAGTLKDLHTYVDEKLPKDGTIYHGSTESAAWSLLHGLQALAQSVTDFVFKAGKLVITIGQTIVELVIQSYEHAMQAATAIFQAAGAALDRLVHWLGYVFDWQDMLRTQRSFSAMAHFFLGSSDAMIVQGFTFLDSKLSEMKTSALALSVTPRDAVKDANNSLDCALNAQKDATVKSAMPAKPSSHPAINYLLNQLTMIFGSGLSGDSGLALDRAWMQDIMTFWTHEVETALEPLKTDLARIKTELIAPFASGEKKDLKSTMAAVGGDAIALLIDLLRTVLEYGVQPAAKLLLQAVRKLLQTPIEIPFLSALYRHATGATGNPSLIDLFCLYIAIPVTILGKITGCQPMPEINQALLQTFVDGATMPAPDPSPHTTTTRSYTDDKPNSAPANSAVEHGYGWYQPLQRCPVFDQFRAWQVSACTILDVSHLKITLSQYVPAPLPYVLFSGVLKVFMVVWAIPMIDSESWDSTNGKSLRFGGWMVDVGVTTVDIVSGCLKRWKIPKADKVNSAVNIFGAAEYLLVQEFIADTEIMDFTSSSYTGAHAGVKASLSFLRVVELLVLFLSKLTYTFAEEDKDLESKAAATVFSAGAGAVAAAMQLGRGTALNIIDPAQTQTNM